MKNQRIIYTGRSANEWEIRLISYGKKKRKYVSELQATITRTMSTETEN